MDQETLRQIISRVIQKMAAYSIASVNPRPIPIRVCSRHAHLPQNNNGMPFGSGDALKMQGELSRPGQFRAEEARRHIHMRTSDAEFYGVADGWTVKVKAGGDRGVIFENVTVIVSSLAPLGFHIDIDEANAAGVRDGDLSAYLILSKELSEVKANTVQPLNDEVKRPEIEPEKLITEETVRQAWKTKTVLIINKGVICTPLARDAIKELGVQAIWR